MINSELLEKMFLLFLDSTEVLNPSLSYPFFSIERNGDGVWTISIIVRDSNSFKGDTTYVQETNDIFQCP